MYPSTCGTDKFKSDVLLSQETGSITVLIMNYLAPWLLPCSSCSDVANVIKKIYGEDPPPIILIGHRYVVFTILT